MTYTNFDCRLKSTTFRLPVAIRRVRRESEPEKPVARRSAAAAPNSSTEKDGLS
jgi:hypothetical protein